MKREARFLPAAELDYLHATRWYEEKSPGQGERFEREIENTIERVLATPRRFQIVRYDIRRAIVKRYPYVVFFREIENVIAVLAVMHTSRDPQLWIDRVDDYFRG